MCTNILVLEYKSIFQYFFHLASVKIGSTNKITMINF